jgi:hypothetical protein
MRTALTLIAASALVATGAAAQGGPAEPNCGLSLVNSCQAKVDLFDYLAPQVGTLVTGGNPTLGQGGALNGFGHASVALRVKAVQGSLPDFRNFAPSSSGTPNRFPTTSAFVPLPAAEASIGLYGGWPLGVTRVGGIDLIGDVSYLPEFHNNSTGLELPDGGLVTGYGARLGLLQEGLLTPGVGFTWQRHELPRMAFHGVAAGTTLRIDDIDMASTSWRATASKSLIAFSVAAGVGQDRYRSSAVINKTSGPSTTFPFGVSQHVSRTSWFGNVATNILLAKLIAEIGAVSGGDIRTYNSFAGKAPDALRLYGSLGVRIGL